MSNVSQTSFLTLYLHFWNDYKLKSYLDWCYKLTNLSHLDFGICPVSSLQNVSSSVMFDGECHCAFFFQVSPNPGSSWTMFWVTIMLVGGHIAILVPEQVPPSTSCWRTSSQHDATATIFHCRNRIGQVMNSAWFPLDQQTPTTRPWHSHYGPQGEDK